MGNAIFSSKAGMFSAPIEQAAQSKLKEQKHTQRVCSMQSPARPGGLSGSGASPHQRCRGLMWLGRSARFTIILHIFNNYHLWTELTYVGLMRPYTRRV